jgi:hypothetical protein
MSFVNQPRHHLVLIQKQVYMSFVKQPRHQLVLIQKTSLQEHCKAAQTPTGPHTKSKVYMSTVKQPRHQLVLIPKASLHELYLNRKPTKEGKTFFYV